MNTIGKYQSGRDTKRGYRAIGMALGACAFAGASNAAFAQSSVTLYGIVDAGITWVSNAGGKTATLMDTGIMQANRLGFRGVEDLGGGLKAIFALETGYNLGTGALGQGGLGFGRQSWVGLTHERYGTVKLGRQLDFMYDPLGTYNTPTLSAGGYGNNPLDNDRMGGQRVNNAVKYLSPSFGGLTLGAMYGFSNLPGQINGNGRTYSFSANYTNGPLSVATAYADISGQTIDISPIVGSSKPVLLGGDFARTWGAGGTYQVVPNVTLYALYTQAIYRGASAAANGTFHNYEGGVSWLFRSFWNFGFGYALTTLNGNKYHQGNLTADYFLSKRTDVYVQSIFQHATGDTAHADVISMPGSSGRNQLLLRVGMRHKF
ncbi:porin [Burkholderia stagnalis]|uniref:porin n=1 Tax=Burkholderia stagnalis TaxID=1503054 RepID=UPI0009C13B19|nr:porin [Burkholderia stagnalis]